MLRHKSAKSRRKTLKHTHKRSGFTKLFLIIAAILVLLAIGLGIYTFKDSLSFLLPQGTRPQVVPGAPTPTPTPIQLTPGKSTYKVGQGKHDGPTISTISFDPLDVKKGQKFTITVEVAAKTPAQNVSATLQSDHKDQSLQFTQSSAAGDAASLWTATITMDDTVWYRYLLDVTATAGSNKSNVIVTPR